MTKPKKDTSLPVRRQAPARTMEAREKQLISLAVDLAEKQLSEGTASSMVITHYLKQSSTSQRLEKEKLIEENKLLRAKTESLKSAKKVEELYLKAIKAIGIYSGQNIVVGDDTDDPADDV